MHIASYVLPDGTNSFGKYVDGKIHDAGPSLRQRYADLRSVLAADALSELNDAAGNVDTFDPDSVELLPPVSNPDKIICIGLNYLGHILETGRDKPEYPSIFTRYPSSLVGHRQPIVRPKVSDWFDFEGELAVVIGKPARAIAAADAMQHVAGYTCFNDGSIRDFQRHTTQFWAGKNFSRSGSMGPWLATADEIGDPDALSLVTRLNGQVMQETAISDLAFKIPALIEYLSTVTELLPGDVIATGTPSGVGLFRDPKVFMKPGDRVEVEISRIGTLENTVEGES